MRIDPLRLGEAVERVFAGLEVGEGGTILTPNVEVMRQYASSASLQRAFEQAELVVVDGVPLVWALRVQRTPVPERITGTDLIWALTAEARVRSASVFLAGGRPGEAQRAADRLAAASPGVQIAVQPCFIDVDRPVDEQTRDLTAAIVDASPDIVFVGLPFAAQVEVIGSLRRSLPTTWFAGIGSSFDFVNGDRTRAPEWLQRLGLEWAFRLTQQPWMWRRYVLQGLPFAARVGAHAVRTRFADTRER